MYDNVLLDLVNKIYLILSVYYTTTCILNNDLTISSLSLYKSGGGRSYIKTLILFYYFILNDDNDFKVNQRENINFLRRCLHYLLVVLRTTAMYFKRRQQFHPR